MPPIVLYKLYINEIQEFFYIFVWSPDTEVAVPQFKVNSQQGRAVAAIFDPVDELRYCCSLPQCLLHNSSNGIVIFLNVTVSQT